MEKLKSCDDAFRRELEVKQRDRHLEIRRVIADKDTEIDKAKQRVLEVEEEMRVLSQETALTKRNLEAKMKHLNKAFADMQQDLAT